MSELVAYHLIANVVVEVVTHLLCRSITIYTERTKEICISIRYTSLPLAGGVGVSCCCRRRCSVLFAAVSMDGVVQRADIFAEHDERVRDLLELRA